MESTSLLRDEPLQPDGDDLFRRRPLARRLAQLVQSGSSGDGSIVYAVVGAWGSGKTSLLHMMEGELDDSICVVRFNPWLVASVDDLLRDFFATLADSVPSADRWQGVREKVSTYGNAAASVLRVVPGAGVLADAVGTASTLAEPKPLGRLRGEAEEALRSVDGAFVVVIDDIDRLQPEELLIMLKVIRLVGRLPHVHYVLAFDEETVLEVLGSNPVAAGSARSIEFLEKIVQVRIDIPGLHPTDLDELVGRSFDEALRASGIELDQPTLDRLRRQYNRYVRPGLRQPRQVARLLSQLQTVLPLVAGEVDVVDLFLLTYLRMRWPMLYTRLPHWASDLPMSLQVAMRERSVAKEDRQAAWTRRLEDAVPADTDRDEAAALMSALFPGFASAHGRRGNSSSNSEGAQRVGSEEYFHRYFQLGIPSDDIRDSAVREAMGDLLADLADTERVEALSTALEERPALVLDKMLTAWDANADSTGSVTLAAFLVHARPHLADRHDLLRPPGLLVDQWVATIAHRWPEEVIETNMRDADLLSPPGLTSLVRGLRWLAKDDETERSTLSTCEQLALEGAERWLRVASQTPLESDELPWVLAYLAELGHDVVVRTWLESVLDTTEWTLASFVSAFVGVMRSTGGIGESRLGEFHADYLGRMLPLREVVERLTSELVPEPPTMDRGDVSLTARRARAFAELRRMRDEPSDLIPVDDDSPITALGPAQTAAPFSAMDIVLRVAIAIPEPVVAAPGQAVAWVGEALETVLERLVDPSGLSVAMKDLGRAWGPHDEATRWKVQASSQPSRAETFFSSDAKLVPSAGVAGRVWLAVRGANGQPGEAGAVEIVTDVGFNLKELDGERRPAGMRHETTPAPVPAAFSLAELVGTIARIIEGTGELFSAVRADLRCALPEGHVGVWLTTGGGEQIERFVDLTRIEQRPGGALSSEYMRAAPWPIPVATLDSPEVALAKASLANALHRSGYRNYKSALHPS